MQKINLKKLQYCLAITVFGISSATFAAPYYDNAGAQRSYFNHRINAVRPRPESSNLTKPSYQNTAPISQPTIQPAKPIFTAPTARQPAVITQTPKAITPPTTPTLTPLTPATNNVNNLTPAPAQAPTPSATKMQNQPNTLQPNNPQKAEQLGWQQYIPPEVKKIRNIPDNFNIKPYVGYRSDNLDWNVAGSNISKLSELTYDSIGMAEAGIEADYTHRDGILSGLYVEAKVAYAKAFSGSHVDSDFTNRLPTFDDNNNPTGQFVDGVFEFSRTEGDSDDGDSSQFSAAIGYEVWQEKFQDSKYSITPLIGYSYQTMDLTMTNGKLMDPRGGIATDGLQYDTIVVPPIIDGTPFQGLDSSYRTTWKGPFIGMAMNFVSNAHMLGLSGKIHRNDFSADATWNLRSDFRQPDSFSQQGDGFGFDVGLDYSYYLSDSWGLFAGFNYKSFSVEDGTDTIFFSDGSVLSGKLNEVNWNSQLYRAGARYSF
jgi:hypothetical protein